MQVRWIAAIIAAAVVVCVGGGVGIGWSVWGKPLSAVNDRNEQLEWAADRLETDLREVEGALRDARAVNHELADRQRRTTAVIDRAAERLAEAAGNAQSITELVEHSISIVDELFVALGGGNPGDDGTGAPSRESQPP